LASWGVVSVYLCLILLSELEVLFMAALSLQLMLYGLAGVFSALAVLYLSIKIVVREAKENKE
jgi:hypothetical protein